MKRPKHEALSLCFGRFLVLFLVDLPFKNNHILQDDSGLNDSMVVIVCEKILYPISFGEAARQIEWHGQRTVACPDTQ